MNFYQIIGAVPIGTFTCVFNCWVKVLRLSSSNLKGKYHRLNSSVCFTGGLLYPRSNWTLSNYTIGN